MKIKILICALLFYSLMALACPGYTSTMTSSGGTTINGVYQVTVCSYQKDLAVNISTSPFGSWTLPPNSFISSSANSGRDITVSFIGTAPGTYIIGAYTRICKLTIDGTTTQEVYRSIQVNVVACEQPAPNTKALSFDGNEDYLEIPAYNGVNTIGEGDFTIEARIKAIGNGRKFPAIVSNRTSGAGFLMFLGDDKPSSTGQPWFNIAGVNYVCSSCPSLLDNTPHMLSVTRTGGMLYMYIDGVLKYSHTSYVGGTNISSTGNIRIGNDFANMANTYFRGDISEVRVWKYARSAGDILAYINKSVSSSSVDLQGYWRLNEGSGQTVYNTALYYNVHGTLGASSTVQTIDPVWSNSTAAISKSWGSSFENSYYLGTVSQGLTFENIRNNADLNGFDDDARQLGNDIIYAFTLPQTSLVTVSLCNSAISDSYVSIINANRKLIKENDDFGYQSSCTNSSQGSIKMNLIAGTYYVVSEAFSNTYIGNISTKITVAAFDPAFGTAEGAREESIETSQRDKTQYAEETHAYPNPVKDGLLFFGHKTVAYSLLNANGEVMLKGIDAESVSVENLPAGLYILKTDAKIEKIVIE